MAQSFLFLAGRWLLVWMLCPLTVAGAADVSFAYQTPNGFSPVPNPGARFVVGLKNPEGEAIFVYFLPPDVDRHSVSEIIERQAKGLPLDLHLGALQRLSPSSSLTLDYRSTATPGDEGRQHVLYGVFNAAGQRYLIGVISVKPEELVVPFLAGVGAAGGPILTTNPAKPQAKEPRGCIPTPKEALVMGFLGLMCLAWMGMIFPAIFRTGKNFLRSCGVRRAT